MGVQSGGEGPLNPRMKTEVCSLLNNVLCVCILFCCLFPTPQYFSPRRENGASWETAATVGECQGLQQGGCGGPGPGGFLAQEQWLSQGSAGLRDGKIGVPQGGPFQL